MNAIPLTANGALFYHTTVGQGAIIASFPPSDQLATGALFIRELIPPAMGQGFLSAFGECLAIDTGDGLDDIHKLIILSLPLRGNRIPGDFSPGSGLQNIKLNRGTLPTASFSTGIGYCLTCFLHLSRTPFMMIARSVEIVPSLDRCSSVPFLIPISFSLRCSKMALSEPK